MNHHLWACRLAWLAAGLGLVPGSAGAAPAGEEWRVFYDRGFHTQPTASWLGEGTRSERAPDGLRVCDPSTAAGSGRLYILAWQADPREGAVVEARLKVASASDPWGVCVNVADGAHEEDISFFPDRVVLSYAKESAPFPAGDAFHTYRIALKGEDIRVWADEKLLLDGTGRFTAPLLEPGRNRLAFGCSNSTATGEAVWQSVRFQGGRATPPIPLTPPRVPGLEVRQEETVSIRPDASYVNMFRFAGGLLSVGGRRSDDGGRTWMDGGGPWVGACQLPDGEVIALDYRTHKGDAEGWYASALKRWNANGEPLAEERARLHVPGFVTTIDDDGSKRDGPWCDHAIVPLRDGSLLAACSGCFREDTTPIPSYRPEWGAKKYRGFVCRSTDRGRTWEYLSTVTADPTLGPEGCNEMDLARAPNGDLLCLFRTGGSHSAPSPLRQCRSTDEGRTWGKPERVAGHGVWPNTVVTGDGVIICTYGRPGNWLAFSVDSGRTWAGHFCFHNGGSTCYNSVEEVSPGRILVTYDCAEIDDSGNQASGVRGTFFTVRKK